MDQPGGSSARRIGGIAGIVFTVGMLVLGFTVYFSQPAFTDSLAEIREHFIDNETARAIADWVSALLFVGGFLLFASALRSALSPNDDDGIWSRVSFGAAVASVGVAGSGVFLATFGLGNIDELGDGVMQAFMKADALIYSAILPWGFAVFVAAASMVILRGGIFAKWMAWFGFAAAAASAVGTLWPVDGDPQGPLAVVGMIGFIAAVVWVALAGFTMARARS